MTLTSAERLVYAAAFAAYLDQDSQHRDSGTRVATEAARAAERAVQDLRMASTWLDPDDHWDRFVMAMLDCFRKGESK